MQLLLFSIYISSGSSGVCKGVREFSSPMLKKLYVSFAKWPLQKKPALVQDLLHRDLGVSCCSLVAFLTGILTVQSLGL